MPLFYQHNINEYEKLGIWKIEEEQDFFLSSVPLHRDISHMHKRLQHLAGRYLLQYLFPDFPYELIEIADTRKPFLNNEAYHFSISHCGDYAAAIVSKYNRVGVDIEFVTDSIQRVQHKFLGDDEKKWLFANLESELEPRMEKGRKDIKATEGDTSLEPANKEGLMLNISDAAHEFQKPEAERFTLQIQEPIGEKNTTGNEGLTLDIKNPHEEKINTYTDAADQKLQLLTLCWSAKEAVYKWYGNGGVDFKKHIQLKQPLRFKESQWIDSNFLFDREAPVLLNLHSRFFDTLVLTYVVSS